VKQIRSLVCGLLLSMALSQAAVVVNFTGTSAGGGGNTLFNYDIDIGTDTTWRTNDFVVLYDFGPVVQAFSVLPSTLVFGATNLTGPNAPAQAPNDSPTVANVQLIYTGANLVGPQFNNPADFTFSLASPSSTTAAGTLNISTQFFDNAGGTGVAGDTSNVPVPASVVPEPATMGMMGGALAGLAFLVGRKK